MFLHRITIITCRNNRRIRTRTDKKPQRTGWEPSLPKKKPEPHRNENDYAESGPVALLLNRPPNRARVPIPRFKRDLYASRCLRSLSGACGAIHLVIAINHDKWKLNTPNRHMWRFLVKNYYRSGKRRVQLGIFVMLIFPSSVVVNLRYGSR